MPHFCPVVLPRSRRFHGGEPPAAKRDWRQAASRTGVSVAKAGCPLQTYHWVPFKPPNAGRPLEPFPTLGVPFRPNDGSPLQPGVAFSLDHPLAPVEPGLGVMGIMRIPGKLGDLRDSKAIVVGSERTNLVVERWLLCSTLRADRLVPQSLAPDAEAVGRSSSSSDGSDRWRCWR